MPATKRATERAGEKKPVFDPVRCKRCGICAHFCPFGAVGQMEDGTPYLAKPELCTSCRLCQDMCPDWAIRLTAASPGEAEEDGSESAGKGSGTTGQKGSEQA
jgi:2-oxoglutarate ferredoxin oxidoreductase subunit delta